VKKILIPATILGTCVFVFGAGAALGVVLGSRTLVASAAAVKPVATLTMATGQLGTPPVQVAMRDGSAPAAQ
jgi:hypothetical protein